MVTESNIESYNPVVRLARALLNQSSKLGNSSTTSVTRKRTLDDDEDWLPTCLHLLELTDGCLMLYAQAIHQQMDKVIMTSQICCKCKSWSVCDLTRRSHL